MTRAEQASREAAAVRARAEELSRRFGAGGAEFAADMAAAAAVPPTETASINPDANAAEVAQPAVEQVLAPADEQRRFQYGAACNGQKLRSSRTWRRSRPSAAKRKPLASAPPQRQPVQAAVQNGAPAKKPLAVDPAAPKPEIRSDAAERDARLRLERPTLAQRPLAAPAKKKPPAVSCERLSHFCAVARTTSCRPCRRGRANGRGRRPSSAPRRWPPRW